MAARALLDTMRDTFYIVERKSPCDESCVDRPRLRVMAIALHGTLWKGKRRSVCFAVRGAGCVCMYNIVMDLESLFFPEESHFDNKRM
jgi:hypothetical protein